MDFLVTQENWVFSSRIKKYFGMHIAYWHFNKMNGLPVVIAGINCLVPVTESKMPFHNLRRAGIENLNKLAE